MIVSDRWRRPTGGRQYIVTEKELPESGFDFGGKRYAYWTLARQIEDKFGNEPATVYDIYNHVTGPLGLSSSDTIELVRAARREGYLK